MADFTHDVGMENFEAVVETNPYVVLYFWAGWCAPCQLFAPIYEEAARRHPDIFFGKVNTEIARELSQAFQVRSVPTIMAFHREELIFEQAGALSPAMIESLVGRLSALS